MGKSKITEQRTAKIMYVQQHKDAKEIAKVLTVSEKSVGDWIKKGGWKALRDVFVNGHKKQVEQIREVITSITERRLLIDKNITEAERKGDKTLAEELRVQSISLGDEVSKWNKTLENLDKDNRISLGIYLQVMDEVFTAIQVDHPDIYMKLLDFQEKHISQISIKY